MAGCGLASCCRRKPSRMTTRERLFLTPVEKFLKYGIVPWKLILNVLLLILVTTQVVLMNTQDSNYVQAAARNWFYFFYPADYDFSDVTWYTYTVNDTVDAVQRAVGNYYSLNALSPDMFGYTLIPDPAWNGTAAAAAPLVPEPLTLEVTSYANVSGLFHVDGSFDGAKVTSSYALNGSYFGPLDYALGEESLRHFFNGLVDMQLKIPHIHNFAFGTLYRNCFLWALRVNYNFVNRGQVELTMEQNIAGSCDVYASSAAAWADKALWLNFVVIAVSALHSLLLLKAVGRSFILMRRLRSWALAQAARFSAIAEQAAAAEAATAAALREQAEAADAAARERDDEGGEEGSEDTDKFATAAAAGYAPPDVSLLLPDGGKAGVTYAEMPGTAGGANAAASGSAATTGHSGKQARASTAKLSFAPRPPQRAARRAAPGVAGAALSEGGEDGSAGAGAGSAGDNGATAPGSPTTGASSGLPSGSSSASLQMPLPAPALSSVSSRGIRIDFHADTGIDGSGDIVITASLPGGSGSLPGGLAGSSGGGLSLASLGFAGAGAAGGPGSPAAIVFNPADGDAESAGNGHGNSSGSVTGSRGHLHRQSSASIASIFTRGNSSGIAGISGGSSAIGLRAPSLTAAGGSDVYQALPDSDVAADADAAARASLARGGSRPLLRVGSGGLNSRDSQGLDSSGSQQQAQAQDAVSGLRGLHLGRTAGTGLDSADLGHHHEHHEHDHHHDHHDHHDHHHDHEMEEIDLGGGAIANGGAGGAGGRSHAETAALAAAAARALSESWTSLTWRDKLRFLNGWALISLLADACNVASSAWNLSLRTAALPSQDGHAFLMASGLALLWVGAIRYMEHNRTYFSIILTLRRAGPRVLRFLVGILPVFVAYGLFAVVMFADRIPRFADVRTAFITLFANLNGDVVRETFMAIVGYYPIIGQIYFYSFIALHIYVVLNIIIAVVEESYFITVTKTQEIEERAEEEAARAEAARAALEVQRAADASAAAAAGAGGFGRGGGGGGGSGGSGGGTWTQDPSDPGERLSDSGRSGNGNGTGSSTGHGAGHAAGRAVSAHTYDSFSEGLGGGPTGRSSDAGSSARVTGRTGTSFAAGTGSGFGNGAGAAGKSFSGDAGSLAGLVGGASFSAAMGRGPSPSPDSGSRRDSAEADRSGRGSSGGGGGVASAGAPSSLSRLVVPSTSSSSPASALRAPSPGLGPAAAPGSGPAGGSLGARKDSYATLSALAGGATSSGGGAASVTTSSSGGGTASGGGGAGGIALPAAVVNAAAADPLLAAAAGLRTPGHGAGSALSPAVGGGAAGLSGVSGAHAGGSAMGLLAVPAKADSNSLKERPDNRLAALLRLSEWDEVVSGSPLGASGAVSSAGGGGGGGGAGGSSGSGIGATGTGTGAAGVPSLASAPASARSNASGAPAGGAAAVGSAAGGQRSTARSTGGSFSALNAGSGPASSGRQRGAGSTLGSASGSGAGLASAHGSFSFGHHAATAAVAAQPASGQSSGAGLPPLSASAGRSPLVSSSSVQEPTASSSGGGGFPVQHLVAGAAGADSAPITRAP